MGTVQQGVLRHRTLRLLRMVALISSALLLSAESCDSNPGGEGGSGGEVGAGGEGGTGETGGSGGVPGGDPCVVDQECNPFDISDCDTPCRAFCPPGGTEVYGECGTNVDPSKPPPGGKYYCVCHCYDAECP